MSPFTMVKKTSALLLVVCVLVLFGCKDYIIQPPPDEEVLPTDAAPAWSPDGRWIAYYHEDYTNSDSVYPNGLYVIDTSGNNRRLLVPGYADSPDWSPDGRWIAFRTGAIYAINFQGDSIRQITPFSAHFPSWSPDGTKIACGRSGPQDTVGIWIVEVETRQAYRFGFGASPDWSPDGAKFVYAAATGPFTTGVILVPVNNPFDQRILVESRNENRNPRWSGNELTIGWTVYVGPKPEVWVMNTDATTQRKLTDGKEPSWSPDSRMIVASKLNLAKTKYVLWIMKLDGTNLYQITH